MKIHGRHTDFCGGKNSEHSAEDGKLILTWIFKLSELELVLTGTFKNEKLSGRRIKEGKRKRRRKRKRRKFRSRTT
jgi:hypothetical protein